jgi:Gas vesicle synthesis protein GvpL/GvpF
MSNSKQNKRKAAVGKVQSSAKASKVSSNGRPHSARATSSKPQLVAKMAGAAAPAPQRVRSIPSEPEREIHTLPADTRLAAPSPVAAPQQEGRYVYGVIQARDAATFGKTGIGGSGELVYTVHHGDIAAVVSKTAVFIFDPTRENALAHEHVIETVMKTQTIIPMSFGTVFRTDEDIREVLKSIYPSLKDVLKQMEGKLEFGLKVTWDREQVIDELKRDDEEIHRFHQEITRKHLQSTYLARMQLGRMIDKALVERSAQYVREIYDALRSVCVASRDNKPIGDKMIMNAAFLIEKAREGDFDAAVNRIARKFGDRLNFKYTGPWPPYNFVNIRLKLERGTAS